MQQASIPKHAAGSITGTTADLRRLSMPKARQILLDFGVSDAEIEGAPRLRATDIQLMLCSVPCRCIRRAI